MKKQKVHILRKNRDIIIYFFRKFKNSLIIFLSLFLALANTAMADNFYPSGDSRYCDVAQTTAIGIHSLPINSSSSGLTYDGARIKGVNSSWIESTNFNDVGDLTYPDARRINEKATTVSVPPNSNIALGVYFYNFSGHRVDLKNSIFFISKNNPLEGDLTRLGANGINSNFTFRYGSRYVERKGKAIIIPNWLWLEPNTMSNLPKGKIFATFKTIQPIKIIRREVKPVFKDDGRLFLEYALTLKNVSSYFLSNIGVSEISPTGEISSKTQSFNPGEEKIISNSFCMCYDYPYNLSVPNSVVSDPNNHIESAAEGVDGIFSYDPNSRSFFSERNDSSSPLGWSAVQGDLTISGPGDFLKVELLPYKIFSKEVELNVKPDVKSEVKVIDSDEVEKSANQIEKGENQYLEIKYQNDGAYLKNIETTILFDNHVFDFVEGGQLITDNKILIKIDRIDNSENITKRIEFKAKDDLSVGSYETNFEIESKSSNYLDEKQNILTTVISKESSQVDTVTKTINEVQIYDLRSKYLASTGKPLYFFVLVSSIILLWSLRLLIKTKNLKQSFLSMCLILEGFYKKKVMNHFW